MRRLPEVLVVAVCVISAVAFTRLPAVVAGDVSWLVPFDAPAREGSRALLAFLVPSILVLLLAAFRWASSARGRASTSSALPSWLGTPGGHSPEYEKFTSSMDLIIVCVVALLASIQFGFLATALGWHGPTSMLVGLVFGLALAAMGNVMPRLRPNPIAGLRTKEMLDDPIAWRSAHASFGRLWVVGGALVIAVALVAPRYSMLTALAAIIVSIMAGPFLARNALTKRHNSAI